MVRKIRKAAVIGSGIMGGGIAALLAGAGVHVLLLDIVPFDLTDEEKKAGVKKEAIQINDICSQHHRQPVSITNGSTMLVVGDVIHGDRQY